MSTRRDYPQVSLTAKRLKLQLKAVLVQARAAIDNKSKETEIADIKADALKQAEQILFKFADYLILYTFNSRVKNQLSLPINLTEKQKENLKTELVKEKLADFTKILDDTLRT